MSAPLPPKVCEGPSCEVTFTPSCRIARYCSKRCKKAANNASYRASPKGKAAQAAAQAAYSASPKGKAAQAAAQAAYRASPKGKAAQAAYSASPQRKAAKVANEARRRSVKAGATHETFTPADLLTSWEDRGLYGCTYCGAPLDEMHTDHAVPIASGGAHAITNLVPACPSCNLSKGPKLLLEEWVPPLLSANSPAPSPSAP